MQELMGKVASIILATLKNYIKEEFMAFNRQETIDELTRQCKKEISKCLKEQKYEQIKFYLDILKVIRNDTDRIKGITRDKRVYKPQNICLCKLYDYFIQTFYGRD